MAESSFFPISSSVTITADTEFSTAAALADATSNPTTTLVGALLYGYNGTTWDRIRFIAHDSPDSGAGFRIDGFAIDPTSLPTAVGANDRTRVYTSLQGELLSYKSRLDAGEDLTNNVQAFIPKAIAGSTYTGTVTQNNNFQTTNVKASAGNVLKISIINTTASARYFQIHNTTTTPGGGATAAFKWLIPANSQVVLGPADLGDAGLYNATGIAIANSTAASTYTAGTGGDLLVEITTI